MTAAAQKLNWKNLQGTQCLVESVAAVADMHGARGDGARTHTTRHCVKELLSPG